MKYKQGLEAIARGGEHARVAIHLDGPPYFERCPWCTKIRGAPVATLCEVAVPGSTPMCAQCLAMYTPGTSDAEVEAAERRCWPKVEAALPRPGFITRLLRRIGVTE